MGATAWHEPGQKAGRALIAPMPGSRIRIEPRKSVFRPATVKRLSRPYGTDSVRPYQMARGCSATGSTVGSTPPRFVSISLPGRGKIT